MSIEQSDQVIRAFNRKNIAQTNSDRAEEEVPFCCPICGSGDYDEHTESNGILGPGGHTWVTHYECKGCTVHFGDPKKFTTAKTRKKEEKEEE